MIVGLCLLWLAEGLAFPNSIFVRPEKADFLQQAAQLSQELKTKQTPESFCRYVVFVMDYYAFQVDFNSFYFRDLQSFSELQGLRKSSQGETVLTKNGALVEMDLRKRIQSALEKDPKNSFFKFSAAYYLWKGRNLTSKNVIDYSPTEVREIFKTGAEKGCYTAESLFFLALQEMAMQGISEDVMKYLEKAYEIRDGSFEISIAYLNALIERKRFQEALPIAQDLVDFTTEVNQKRMALEATARLFFELKDYNRALSVAEKLLERDPKNPQATLVMLETFRKKGDREDYERKLDAILGPDSYLLYLGFLKSKGALDWDFQFMEDFVSREPAPEEPLGWRSSFGGFFFLQEKKYQKAEAQFQIALKSLEKDDGDHQRAIQGLRKKILECKTKMTFTAP